MCFVGAALRQSGRQWDDTFCPPARLLYHFWGESRNIERNWETVLRWWSVVGRLYRGKSKELRAWMRWWRLITNFLTHWLQGWFSSIIMVGCWVDFLSQGWLDPGHVMEILNPTQGSAWWAITGASDPVAGYLWQVIENWKFEWILQ